MAGRFQEQRNACRTSYARRLAVLTPLAGQSGDCRAAYISRVILCVLPSGDNRSIKFHMADTVIREVSGMCWHTFVSTDNDLCLCAQVARNVWTFSRYACCSASCNPETLTIPTVLSCLALCPLTAVRPRSSSIPAACGYSPRQSLTARRSRSLMNSAT